MSYIHNVAGMKQFSQITLVHKHLKGELSTEEKKAYDSWLESSGNKELSQDLSQVWDLSAEYSPTSFKPDATKAFNKFKQQIASEINTNSSSAADIPVVTKESTAKVIKMNPMKWVSRIAASLVFVAACFYLIGDRNDGISYDQQIFAEVIQNTSLEDGTSVWLDNGATLALANDYGATDRKLKLEGKAFFNVERNEAKPFILDMGGNTLEVLGTSFNVDNSTKDVIVEVKSGLVKVSTKNESMELKAGQRAVLNYDLDKIKLEELSAGNFEWFESKLMIRDMSISDAMAKIADFYQVNIDLSSNVDKSCMLTSPLATDSSIENLFEVLAVTHKMQYEKLESKSYQIKFLDCK